MPGARGGESGGPDGGEAEAPARGEAEPLTGGDGPGGEPGGPADEAPEVEGEAVEGEASVGGVPDPARPAAEPERPSSPDRVFRSGGGMAGGVLLLALVVWLGVDALIRGKGHTPWLALATMLLLVPLVSAYTLRPAVFANEERLRVRNPFRIITLPWAAVSALRSGYTNEVLDQAGVKYQLWAIPVSLRARKKAGRAQVRATAGEPRGGGGVFGGGRARGLGGAFGGGTAEVAQPRAGEGDSTRARGDRSMDDLRELAEGGAPGGAAAQGAAAQGGAEVRWAYEVIAPAVAGLVLLAVLLGIG
ncbi:PH domain-containing protein [Streptomyces sp. TS71-3]|uniref:PH domain-containing protein n=1 Tax=Streptomyces sp. TS71-3 TaxID=2733862 RepID=UPI0027E23577|nr:PH domain-containing protein [Streptomyces sp. TS71-3]